jgi:hypothetical protein
MARNKVRVAQTRQHIKYFGKIEDFLSEQRNCRDIHFQDTMGFQAHLHMKSSSFESPKQ